MKTVTIRNLAAAIAGSVLAGCATQYPVSDVEQKLALAKSGTDGSCVVAIHVAAEAILAAEAAVERADGGMLSYPDYKQGMIASDVAIEARKLVAENCTTRYDALRQAVVALYYKTEVLPGVTFATDSAELTDKARTILTALASRLLEEGSRVEIAGHTSATGTVEYNMQLSQKRAQAVVDYLVSKGVDPNNLVAKGYGMSQPVTTNDTQVGRDANKRVELRYLR